MAYVQRVHKNEDWEGDSSLSFSITPSAGGVLVLAVGWRTTATISSVSDNQGNTWDLLQFGGNNYIQGTSTNRAACYIARNVAGAATTVTVTFSANVSSPVRATCHEYSGRDLSTSVVHQSTGQAQQHPGTGSNAITSGNITTTIGGCDLFGWSEDANATPTLTAGTGWTLGASDNGTADERQTNVSTGTYAATFTGNQAFSHNITMIVALAQASSGVDFSGTLAAAASSMSGNASVIGGFSGSLLSGSSSIASALSVIGGFSGSLLAGAPTLAGTLSVIGGFSGALASGSPILSGSLSALVGLSGALAAGQSTMAGNASILVAFSGSLVSASPALAGAVTISGVDRTFAGALASGGSALSSALSVIAGFSGGLVSASAVVAGAASVRVDFSGSLQSASPALAGSLLQLGTVFFEAGLFAQDARVGAEWRVVFPRQGVSFGPVLKGLPWQLRVSSRRR